MRTIIFIVVLSLASAPAFCATGDAITCTDSASNCQVCIEEAGVASAACYVCKAGYALTFTGPTDGTCTKCPAGQGVERGSALSGALASRRSGHQPVTPTCSACSSNCAECSHPVLCTRCAKGRYATSFDSSRGTGSCDGICMSGFTRDVATTDLTGTEQSTVCVPCDVSCIDCRGTGSSNCRGCNSGFYVSSFAAGASPWEPIITCSPCDAGTSSTALMLVTGIQDKTTHCRPCPASCATCAFGASSGCTRCAIGHYASAVSISNSVLTASCSPCTGGTYRSVALNPLTGVENPASVCTERCHASCETCIGPNEGQCTRCAAGYYLSARSGSQTFGTCTACPSGLVKDRDSESFTSTSLIGSVSEKTTNCTTAGGTIGSTTPDNQSSSKKSAAYLAKLICSVAVTVSLIALF